LKIYFLISALFPCAPRQIDREPREIHERISEKYFASLASFADDSTIGQIKPLTSADRRGSF
jgi:hypothetical protein